MNFKKNRVLILAPHTDDGELGAGGTINKLIKTGSDVFYVALSTHESFGVAVIEASACEIRVVVSNVGSLPEVVEDGVSGTIVSSENPEEAAIAIEKYIFDENLRKKTGKSGRERVEKLYNWKVNVSDMINIYTEIIKKK